MDILKNIIKNKLKEISAAKKNIPLEVLRAALEKVPKPRDFKKAISKKGKLCIIAEIKKASPSAGIIRKSFNPADLAARLEESGADALSVLTDRKFFKGDISYIKKVKARVNLPVLRKDFIIDEYQVYESRANGADAILLIARLLTANKLKMLHSLAKRLRISSIVEVNSRVDLIKVLAIKPDIIGINNRNLKTFEIDLGLSARLRPLIPQKTTTVSESGVRDFKTLTQLKGMGFNSVLIGEAFMKRNSISINLE